MGQASGSWTHPYPDLIIGWHTGIRIGAYLSYGGTRFYNNSPTSDGSAAEAELMSIGNGDNHVRVANNLYVSTNGPTGGGIILADDGDIVDMNDAYCAMRFTSGVRIYSANRGGSSVITLGSDGRVTANTDSRAPIFYDNNDTAYYCDPNGTSRIGGIQISAAEAGSTGNGIRFYGLSGDGAGSYNHGAIIERLWGAADQSELLIFKGNDPDTSTIHDRIRIAATGRIVFHSVNGYNDVDSYISGNTGNINGSGYFNGNDLIVTGNVTAYSDIKLKENIKLIENAVSKVKQIDGVTYNRNDLDDKTRRYTGLIAQQVEKVLPEAVEKDEAGLRNLAYGNMVGLLVEAIKEQQATIESLKDRILVLENIKN